MNSILNFIIILAVLLLVSESLAIYRGFKAVRNQFPYLASLRGLNGTYKHTCGASIISDRFLLTAAHCHVLDDLDSYRVSIGAHTREDGQLYAVKDIIEHADFDIIKRKYDIALILLDETIQFSAIVSTIEIDRNFIVGEKPAIATGWGGSEDEYSGLKYLKTTTLTNDDCRNLSSQVIPIVHDFDTICARSDRFEHEYVGHRDSGGPLVSNNKLIGVVSWGKDKIVDGFVRVSEYTEWIEQVMEETLKR